MSELHSEDSYQLRKAQMDVDRRGLEARKAQQELERLVLELEHKYSLIADGRTIDPGRPPYRGHPRPARATEKSPWTRWRRPRLKQQPHSNV